MGLIYQIQNLNQLADYFTKRAKMIRETMEMASAGKKKDIMRAEAHAWEQAASVVANTRIVPDSEGVSNIKSKDR